VPRFDLPLPRALCRLPCALRRVPADSARRVLTFPALCTDERLPTEPRWRLREPPRRL